MVLDFIASSYRFLSVPVLGNCARGWSGPWSACHGVWLVGGSTRGARRARRRWSLVVMMAGEGADRLYPAAGRSSSASIRLRDAALCSALRPVPSGSASGASSGVAAAAASGSGPIARARTLSSVLAVLPRRWQRAACGGRSRCRRVLAASQAGGMQRASRRGHCARNSRTAAGVRGGGLSSRKSEKLQSPAQKMARLQSYAARAHARAARRLQLILMEAGGCGRRPRMEEAPASQQESQ